jgi:tetratricopeptide (TPR) repeat protein
MYSLPAPPARLKRFKRVNELYNVGRYAAALAAGKKFELAIKERFGTDHGNYAIALKRLAMVYMAQGKYAQAEELYQRARAIQEKVLGVSHLDVVDTLRGGFVIWDANGQALAYV